MDASPLDDSSPTNERSESHGGKPQTREERLKLMRERQEQERERKLAQFSAAQEKEEKIRQQKEMERQRKIQEAKSREEQHRTAVEERRKAMELAEQTRRDALLAKMRESDSKLAEKKADKPVYAFGSSTPRQLAYLDKLDTTSRLYNSRLKSAVGEPNAVEMEGRTASACSFTRRALVSSSSDVNSPVHRAKSSSVSTRRPLPSVMTTSVMVKPSRPNLTAQNALANASMTASFAAGENFAVPQVRNVRRKVPPTASASPARKPPVPKLETAKKPSPSVHSISEEADEIPSKTSDKPTPKPPKSHERTSTATGDRKPATRPTSSAASASVVGGAESLGSGSVESSKKKGSAKPAESAVKANTKPAARTASAASTDRKPMATAQHNDKPAKPSTKPAESPVSSTPDVIPKVKEAEVVRTPSPKNVEAEAKANESDQHQSDSERPTSPDDNGLMGQSARKNLLTTEESAKAALAERRRIAREEMEKQKEAERLREEQLQREEEERIQREEEEFRRQEAELLRQAEERRIEEQERLQKAIEEAERQREEDAKRAEEDRLKKLDEELKAKEQAERLEKERQEREEKLRREEEERNERKKRLDAIVSRTRKSMPGGNGNGGGMDLSLTASMIADANSPKLQSPEEETAQTNGFGQNDNRGVDARMSLANTTYTTAYSPNSSGGSEIRATEMSFNTTNGTLDGSALDRGTPDHSKIQQQIRKMEDLSLMDTTGDVNANESFISTKAVASQESQLFNESFSSTSTTYQRLSTSTGLPSTTTSPAATSQPATANGVDSLLKQLNNPVPLDTPPSDSHQTVESPKSAVKPVIDNQQLLVDFVGEKKPNNNDISNGNHPAVDKGFLESLASPNSPHVNSSLLITSAQQSNTAAQPAAVVLQLSPDSENNY